MDNSSIFSDFLECCGMDRDAGRLGFVYVVIVLYIYFSEAPIGAKVVQWHGHAATAAAIA